MPPAPPPAPVPSSPPPAVPPLPDGCDGPEDPSIASATIPGNRPSWTVPTLPGVGGGALARLGSSFSVHRGALGVGALLTVVAVVDVTEPGPAKPVDTPTVVVPVAITVDGGM